MADRLSFSGDALNHDKQLCIFKVDISLHWIFAINIGKVMLWLIYWYVNNVPISSPIGAVLKHNMGELSVILIFEYTVLLSFLVLTIICFEYCWKPLHEQEYQCQHDSCAVFSFVEPQNNHLSFQAPSSLSLLTYQLLREYFKMLSGEIATWQVIKSFVGTLVLEHPLSSIYVQLVGTRPRYLYVYARLSTTIILLDSYVLA
jgi:hypothetical protein